MKKIFTHLFALFLLSLVATSNVWAQETTEISLNFSEGTCNSTSGEYCSSWSSATNPVVTISVDGGNNNLVVSPDSDSFEMHEGSSGSDWKISVDGYEILSYSFMYKTKETGNNVTITANGTIYTSSDEEQELRVTGLTSSEVSFNLAGNNNGIIVTDFVLEVQPLALITLEAGKVYNFKSVGYSGKSMASIDLDRTAIADTDLEDYTQLWYVDNGTVEGTYTLRNLANGLYLQGAGSGTKWPFVENPSNLYYLAVGLGFSMTANSGQNPTQQYWMHYGSGNGCVVGWDANAGATQWIVEEVEFSDEDLQANWNEIASINNVNESVVAEYQSYLEALFNDKACTVPAKTYTTVDELNADADYNNLPDGLKAMVRKVYLNEWDEPNIDSSKGAWGSSADGSKHYAKRFRVQQYEPYSYGEKTSGMLGIYQHTNMNNPTGLVANFRDVIYVMVDGEINEETGARLYIQGNIGDGAMGSVGGTELKEGLNVIPFWGDGYQLFIHYVIDTYSDGALTGHTLSENAPLKIHIEGGHINGFFDTVGDDVNQADTDADWQYYEERATQNMFAVLGQYVMFYMNLYDKYGYGLKNHFGTGAGDVSVAEVMHVWETIDVAQRMTEGLLSEEETNKWSHGKIAYNGRDKLYPSDYSEVFNNRSLAWSSPDGYFMFASSWYTHYQSNNFASIIGRIHIDGDNWGPAHEIGHTHQGPINLPSASETSNNLLANISNWYCGRTTSRLSTLSDALANFNANESFLAEASGGVWTKLQMYTKLWFYYHLAEKNTSFYPRFFELMRRDGIRREQGVALTGSETMLKFYKNACIAAEEDLTDFFAAYGFFVPCEGTFSDDYGHFKTVMTQAEIDAVKAEVAALAEENGWVKNNTILFIDDRIGETYSCLDGTTVLQPRGDGASSGLGELGSVNDYDNNPDNDVAPLTGTYSYSISGSTITMMDATGGVGFAIYDADGNLVGFSNTYSFELSEAAQAAIASGTAKVCVVKADNTTESIADINPAQTQASLLKEFLPVVEELLQYSDATETKVGWYKEKELTKLLAAYNNAKSVYDEGNLAAYAGAYTVLYDEYINVKNSATAKIEFVDNRTYYLKNVSTQKYMTVDSDGNVVTTSTVPTTEETASLWQLNAGNYDTFYSLKNQNAGKYIRYPQKEGNDYVNGQQFVLTTDVTTFIVEEFSIGKFTIKDLGSQKYFNDYGGSGNVKTYGSIDDGSKWEIVYLPIDETMEERAKLEDQILLTQVLIDEVGYANYEQLVLQKDPNQANYLYCNAPHSSDDGNGVDGDYVKNLTDGNTGSYLHTVWSGNSADGENHYLRVDLGSGNELDIIRFVYATRNSSNLDMPSKMLVQGSNSETTGYETLATLTKDDTTNPLPTAASVISWYRSSKITSGTPYRYYRFMVEETERGLEDGNGHYTFTMSEFQLYKPVLWLNDEYNTDENLALLNATFNELTESRELLLKTATAEELQTAYNELYAAYEDLLTAKESVDASSLDLEKQKLQTLINSANELIAQCKEGEITKVDATESSVALQSTDESAANHLYCNAPLTSDGGASASNGYNLLDNDASTYLHTNNNNYDGEDNYGYHYLRVDLGEGNSTAYFKFGYQNRNPSSYKVFPKILDIQGSNDNVNYESIVTLSSGLPDGIGGTYGPSSVLGNGKEYRYFRFVVKSTYYGGGEPDYFCMAEFDFWTATIDDYSVTLSATCGNATEEMVLDAYRAVQSASKAIDIATTEEQLQTAYYVLEAAYKVLEEAKNMVDKTALQAAYDEALELYNKMADAEGNVTSDYAPSTLTVEQLAAAKTALDAAKDKLDNSNEQGEINTAKGNLETAFEPLNTVESLNVAATKDKSGLEALIDTVEDLLDTINGKADDYYATATGIAIDELQEAYDAAVDAVSRYYLTETQYTEAYDALDGCYTTTNGVVAADYTTRDELTTLIANVNTFMEKIADAAADDYMPAVPLQATDEEDNFYIKLSKVGDGTIGNLIDKNSDGTGNTGTYVGSAWGGTIADYTHYVQVDLGEGVTIDKLLFDYTTRSDGDYSTERPTLIKVLGSNDNSNYAEITIIDEGLADEAGEQWSMQDVLELGARYRYIRFAVKSGVNSFHMSDFNLYAEMSHTLKEYYTTAQGLDFEALCMALQSAEYAAEHYITSEQLTVVKNMLNGYYTAANTIVEADVEAGDRKDLTDLVAETEILIGEVATVTEVVTPVLSTTNLYCNADNSTNNSAGDNDKRGVAALLDGDVTTHLHTTYGNNAQDDNLDHYIRVDMGENNTVAAFEFSYTGRSNNSGNDPSTIIIQGCNTVDGEWVDIKTLTNLPTDGDKVQYSSGLIEASEAYRYIRFMVTETQTSSATTTYDGYTHPFFVMSEFGFTACPTVEINENYPRVTTALVRAAYDEKNTATAENGHYMTESDYNAALAALQADYDALDAAATVDKSELESLIEATTLLKNSLYEMAITSYTPNEVTLSITEGEAGYIYCNAPEKNSTWETDNAGVAALIDLTEGGDPDLTTFLHTEYGNDQSEDGLDHYLRVDLGVDGATDYIEFGYFGRSGSDHVVKSPKKVIVAATNDLTDGGEWTTIATLNPAQASATVETKTGCLGNGVAYRYWRFLVEETHGGGKDGNNHQFFCMTQFNVYKCTDVVISSQLKSEYNPNIHIYTTTELVTEVENAISAATTVKDDPEVLQPAVDAAVVALQPVYDKLAHAVEYYWCPVKLTTDVSNPALYTINAPGRGDSKAWQYNAQNNNITIVNKDASNLYHLWYFMLGGEEQTVKIIPVMTPEYGLSATDFTNGDNKVSAVAENCVNWSFAYVNNYYNFKPHGRNIYLSNIYGGSYPLGFYGSADGGSYVNFTAVEVEDYALTRLAKLAEGKSAVTACTTVGYCDEATGGVYNEALEAANGMVAAASSTPQDYIDAFTRLFNASNGLVINMPQSDKFYVLRCNHENRYIYVNAENKLQWAASSYDKALSNAVWVFEDVDASAATCKMKSLHTQSYLSGFISSNKQWEFGEEGKVVTLVKSPSVDGAVIFKIEGNDNNGLHAHGENNTVVSYTNDAGANHYFFEEVEDVTTIKHTVTMSAVFSSVMLGYNATVPAGVKAYNAIGIDGGYVSLGEVAVPGETLPAGTPVILYRTDDATSKVFTYSEETPVSVDGESLLGGSLFVKYVACEDGKDYYKLMLKDGEAKMYWMYKEFNANGESTDSDDKNAGGHIKCSANKIYMALPNSGSNPVTMYGMRFIDDSATGIEEMKGENGEVKAIYDLQGRKLTEITEPGMYIVDGKKVYVK